MTIRELPLKSFKNRAELREWLSVYHGKSEGLRVRLFKKASRKPSITFHDLLEEGLCFGWSESKRLSYDADSYIQIFTPRRKKTTTSARNKALVEKLIDSGDMTQSGLDALCWAA